MGKTKTTSKQMPKGSSELKVDTNSRPNFDYADPNFAEEHYGKYIIVKNSNCDHSPPHNRFYLCHTSLLEYMQTYSQKAGIEAVKRKGVGLSNLISLFPDKKEFITELLTVLLGSDRPNRERTLKMARGIGFFLTVIKVNNIEIDNMSELKGKHLKMIKEYVQQGNYTKSTLTNCSEFLHLVVKHFSLKLDVPNLRQYARKKDMPSKELSLAVTWQLDIYAKREIEYIIGKVDEYRQWMKELEEIGDLFSKKNLIYTFFNNIDTLGSGSGIVNTQIRNLALSLYDIKLRCWNNTRNNNQKDKACEKELRKISEGGINITIRNERMFAMWHKVIAPNFPFDKNILPKYQCIYQGRLLNWRYEMIKSLDITAENFNSRIIPTPTTIYPFYLLALCRSALNQDTLKDWRIWKDDQKKYCLGVDSGMGRIVDGRKARGNTMQSTALDQEMRRFVDFYTEYASPIYVHSKNDYFFQYINMLGTIDSNLIETFGAGILGTLRKRKDEYAFYTKYFILDEEILPNGKRVERRIDWIDHTKIRKVINLSRYLEGKTQWERQYLLGQKNELTEYIYQQSAGFEQVKNHRIARTQKNFLDFLAGKISLKENPRFGVFSKGPLADCKDPFNPTYSGAKKLSKNDVCTSWRKCLTECGQCMVIAPIHGPVIVAWRDCMDDMRSLFDQPETWDQQFLWDYMAAEATLELFPLEVLKECEAKAPKYIEFVKREVLNSQRSRKLSKEEYDAK